MSVTRLMNSSLTFALIQTDLVWENPQANLLHFEQLLNSLTKKVDVIVLPEMFTTGFSMRSKSLAEKVNGSTVGWMKLFAKKKEAAIVGSIVICDNNQYYNRLHWVCPDGTVFFYDKKHLFSMADENKHYESGTKRLIIEYKGWKFCPLICYDLRFPVWSRNDCDYDCLIYIANWPAARIGAWSTLLEARAIENQCYVLGVNRIGIDGSGIKYNGGTVAVDAKGQTLSSVGNDSSEIAIVELDKESQREFRKKFPVLLDRDDFDLT